MKDRLYVEPAANDDLQNIWKLCTDMARTMAYPSYFCSGEWLKAAAQSLSLKDSILILVVKADKQIKAILPLVGKQNMLGGKDLHFLGADYFPDPLGLISSPEDRAVCANILKEYLLSISGWDRLVLDWVLQEEMAAWNLPNMQISVEPFKVLPQDPSDLLRDFKQKKRYNLRSMARKFIEAGGEFIASTGSETHYYFLDNLFELHRKRAAERNLDSTFDGIQVDKFHRQLVKDANYIRFYALSLKQRIIAVLYGFEFGDIYFYYQIAHDPGYGELSPGSVLLFLTMEKCCSNGVKEFNFLQGNETYKAFWTNESRALYRCVLAKGTLRSSLFQGLASTKKIIQNVLGK